RAVAPAARRRATGAVAAAAVVVATPAAVAAAAVVVAAPAAVVPARAAAGGPGLGAGHHAHGCQTEQREDQGRERSEAKSKICVPSHGPALFVAWGWRAGARGPEGK